MKTERILVLSGLVILAALSRLFPHPWNFSPIAAIALFAGAHFSKKSHAFMIPFAALLLSDSFLGFYGVEMLFVYLSYAISILIGRVVRTSWSWGGVMGVSVFGSLQFFLVTNFGVWAGQRLYPATGAGLLECYSMALPFFRGTLLGDLFYTAVLFGAFALAEKKRPFLREQIVSA